MRRALRWAVVAVLLLVGAVALAQAVVPDPGNTGDFIGQVVAAASHGNYAWLAILVAVGAVYVLRHVGTRLPWGVGAFFQTKRGGALTALLGGVVTALAGLLSGRGPVSLSVLLNGVVLGVGAAGGWNVVKDLVWSDKSRPDFYPTPPAKLS